MKPVQGFEAEGIEGLARGAVQGVSGLVLKPLSGFFDFATSTAEGVASQARLQLPERQRAPRMTYGESRVVRVYNKDHAFLHNYFEQIPGMPESVNFQDYLFDQAKGLVLVLSTEHLFVIDTRERVLQMRVSLWRILAVSSNRLILELVVTPRTSLDPTAAELSFSSANFCAAAKKLVETGMVGF
jgi:hypothetical protein